MLEFMAVLPTLRNSRKVAEYAVMYLGPHRDKLPAWARLGFLFTLYSITAPLAGWIIRKMIVWFLAPYFIATNEKKSRGAPIVIDVLGEAVLSFPEAHRYIDYLHSLIASNFGKEKLHISVKFSSFYPHFYPANYDEAKRCVADVFAELLRAARRNNVHVTVDVEDSQVACLTEDIFLGVVCSEEFSTFSDIMIALQTYRKDAMTSASRIVSSALRRGAPIGVRLVKGAYWDTEMIVSEKNGWQFPLFEEKQETDTNFREIARYFLSNKSVIQLACGTHSPESIASVIQIAEETQNTVEFQVLLGIGDQIWPVLAELDLPVRIFVPIIMSDGSLEDGMAYFARRLQENTASNGAALALLGGK